MKTSTILISCFLMLICGCAHTSRHSNLPAWQIEGHQISHPLRPNVRYYFAGQNQVSGLPSEPKKYVGFWISEDSGQNWTKRSSIPGFEEVFAHPKTGLLYALILDEFLHKETNGVLVPAGGRKLIMSSDGKDWKDITPAGSHLPNGFCIFPDPDNTTRICVLDRTLNLVVYQALEDDLSDWRSYPSDEWSKSHAGWNWTGFFAEFDAEGPLGAARHCQTGSACQEKLRQRCHEELSKKGSHPHDAFLHLKEVGNKETVPLLIAALRWQDAPATSNGMERIICTTEHCIEALETLTGEDFDFDQHGWEKWWEEKGRNLPSEHFHPRAVNTQ